MSCQVKVKQGVLKGQLCNYNGKEYYSFEGIPYAKPPIGNLRFREPQKPESWAGVRDALKPGNSCIQLKPGTKEFFGSEDCLYLNVYTPSLPDKELKKLPVLFYVHGGRFIFGFGDYYRPDYLVEQDVILVTCNYRLHALGFLCLHIPEAAGNMAIKDTVMALKWVKENISHFNGDENNIVAFGESAGAAFVTSYVTSKMTNGLVNKIIALSGVCLSDLFIVDHDPVFKAKQIAKTFEHEFQDVRSLYEYLIQLPVEQLLYAAAMLEFSRPQAIICAYFLPVVEKKFEDIDRYFDEAPLITLRQNRHQKLPTLIGVNMYEAGFFIHQDKSGQYIYEEDLRYFIPRFFEIPPYTAEATEITNKMRSFYLDGATTEQSKKKKYIKFVSDTYFNRDILTHVNTLGKDTESRLYVFRLSYLGKMNTRKGQQLGVKGTIHGDLLQYIFYKKNKADIANEKDKEIISVINQIISNFAKNGDILTHVNTLGKDTESRLYVFRLSYLGKMNTRKGQQLGVKGTIHGDLLLYIFYKKNKADIANEKDKEIISVINQIISNFAKNGLPRWLNMPVEWKPYSTNKREFMDIDEDQKLLQDFGNGIDRFWNSLGKRSKL